MAYNEELADRMREALAHVPRVEEKRMFRGITFMVDGKMCISVGDDEIMCRVDPAIHDEMIAAGNCRTVIMKGREYKGYLHVSQSEMKMGNELEFWVQLALDYNSRAKAAKKKPRKT